MNIISATIKADAAAIHPSDAAQAHALTQTRAAREKSIHEVQLAYQEFLDAGERVSDGLVNQVNIARGIGMHLAGLKKEMRGDFGKLFKSDSGKPNQNPSFDFTAEYGRTFMRLSAALPNAITSLPEAVHSLKDVMIMAGALPESSRGEQQARGDMNLESHVERIRMAFFSQIGKHEEKFGDPSQWKPSQRAHIRASLQPIVEFARKLDACA
jgi:hypothetical protein